MKERGNQVDRPAGYSNHEEVLRREVRIKPTPYEVESSAGGADEGRGIVDTMLSREPAGTPAYVEGTPESGENGFITSM